MSDKASETANGPSYNHVDVDPVTFEVVRHRLMTINEEQAAALKAVSGSPIVSEADDYNTGIYRAGGELVAMGHTVIYHAASMSEMVKHVIADCSEDPGIGEGDAFIVNSPFKGALHAPDVAILQPIFHDGKHIAWTGATAHQLDIGGMNHGGFMPAARDVYQEGLMIPPVKLVDAGRVRTDVWRMIIGMSRLSEALSLNLKGLIAANRVGARGLETLIDRYGLDAVLSVMDGVIDASEQAMRARLTELPDGVFRARTYLDHDGFENRLYEIAVEMHKHGDALSFDFAGSSPQAPGFVNCTRTGLIAGVYAGILPILAYDLIWNAGVLRCVDISAPPGLIVTAEPPAPVSQGPLGSMWLAETVTTEVVSKLVATHPLYISEAQAGPGGAADLFNPSGVDQYGEYGGWLLLEQMSTGGGAYVQRDGLDPQGHRCITACRVPNVEYQERISPFLYLYRKLIADSGGAGRRRGGISAGAAVTLHNAFWSNGLAAGHGFESPNARGLLGGHPGRMNARRLVRTSDLWQRIGRGELPAEVGEVQGVEEELPAKIAQFHIGPGDVLELLPQAGGGWGDPFERPAHEVARDVREGLIEIETAAFLYGVVVDREGVIDTAATEQRRNAEIERRRSWPVKSSYDPTSLSDLAVVALAGDRMAIVADGEDRRYVRCSCGRVLAPAEKNWKLHVGMDESGIEGLGRPGRLHEDLTVRFFACPSCGRLLDVEISRRDEEPLFDFELAPGARIEEQLLHAHV